MLALNLKLISLILTLFLYLCTKVCARQSCEPGSYWY